MSLWKPKNSLFGWEQRDTGCGSRIFQETPENRPLTFPRSRLLVPGGNWSVEAKNQAVLTSLDPTYFVNIPGGKTGTGT
jgi:hypothetical protein